MQRWLDSKQSLSIKGFIVQAAMVTFQNMYMTKRIVSVSSGYEAS